MAASTRRLSVLFLVLVLAHSQVQARESKFFSKVTHSTDVAPGKKKPAPTEIPVAAPESSLAPGPAPAYVEKEYGYGLYGHESDMLPPARETYTPVTATVTPYVNQKATTATPATPTTGKEDNFEDQFVREELSGKSVQTGYNNNGYTNTGETNGYANNYNTNAFTGTYSTGYPGNSNGNGYGTEKQGMSDTRYLEDGKYYYSGKSENSYLNGHEPSSSGETNGYANNYNTNAFTSTYSTTGQSENYNANGYPGNSNGNGYRTEKQGMSDTRYLEKGKYSYSGKGENSYLNGHEPSNSGETNGYANSYNTNAFTSTYSTTGQSENYNANGYPGNSNGNGYGTEKQGMSDTRYLENGKYSYRGKSENSYLNGYEPEKAATGTYANYDDNSSNSNEFDTMEEYYKKQGYKESQEVYEP